MKKMRLLSLFILCVLLGACTALQAPSQRPAGGALTDFAHPEANHAYYEFSSSPLDRPSVLDETQPADEQPEEEPADDEDFTAENVASAYGTYGDAVVTVATHKFNLGVDATRQDMVRFQKALDSGYSAALSQYRPIGFTYAMSSVGAVNPLSDIEVTCKLSERSANQVGQQTCKTFFSTITRRYGQLSKGAN